MRKTTLITSFLISFTATIVAQTVNTGEIIVTDNTVISFIGDFNNTASGVFMNDGDAYVYNNWNNEGVVDFFNKGITRFKGDTPQVISGTNTSYLYDIQFDNTATQNAFELSGDISLANNSDFSTGIIDNKNFNGNFTFEQFANHTNATNNSYIEGLIIKIGNNPFTYPIGDDNFYRYAKISAPDDVNDNFISKYFYENPDENYPLTSKEDIITLVNDQEYWTLIRDIGSSNIIFTLSWDENTTTPESIIALPEEAIHIVRWDETQGLWVDQGGVVDLNAKIVSTPLTLDNYGVFTLARVRIIPLPDKVVIFNGVSPNDDGANDYFLIENAHLLANNRVRIYNRWGIQVFDTKNYDTNNNVFRGYSDGRLTVGKEMLPSGTYFYVLTYDYITDNSKQSILQEGYLYLKTN